MRAKAAIKVQKHDLFAKRLIEVQKEVRAAVGGRVFSEQEVVQLVRKSAKDSA